MKILGIDTATKFLSVGIFDDGRVCEYNLETAHKLSSLLEITLQRILDALNWSAADVDYFACGLGPGSFTGMRVGLSAIKGLSWALKKPLVGVSTLDILAQSVRQSDSAIIPVIDAKRNLLYCSAYHNKKGSLLKNKPYMLLTEDEFFRLAKPNSIFLGDAAGLYKDKILMHVKGAHILDKDYWYPKGHNLITLALKKIEKKKFADPFDIEPIYLYPKECQVRGYHAAK